MERYFCIEIITIESILAGKSVDIPLSLEVLRFAERQIASGEQLTISQIIEDSAGETA